MTAFSVGCISLLGLVAGCGGDSGRAPNGVVSVKGLYVGMPADSALKACAKLAGGSKDLLVVDYREGIGPELDEEAKAKAKKEYEDTVKLAEADIDRFLQWHGIHGGFYDPSREGCEGREAEERDIRPYVGSENTNTPIPGANWVVGTAMAAFAGINGYQVEWMLPGKRKGESGEKPAPKLYSGKVSVPEKMNDKAPYAVWNSEVLEKGLCGELYSKGLQLSKENEKRVFFRLAFEDAQGSPVDKKKLATELVLNDPEFFEEFGSNEEKIEAAEKELEGFSLWVEFLSEQNFGGSSIKGVSLLDPDDPRPENVKEREKRDAAFMSVMAKRGDARGMEKMNAIRQRQGLPPMSAKGNSNSSAVAKANNASPSASPEDTAELNKMKAELRKLQMSRQRGSRAAVEGMKKKIARKESEMKKKTAAQEKSIAEAKAADEKAAAEKKAEEESDLAKKNRTDLRFLTAARTGHYNNATGNYAYQFSEAMMKMACNCKVMLEWAVLTEPADKIEEIVEAFSIPASDYESAVKFASKLDSDLGIGAGGWDSPRKRVYFEKDLEDIRSPLWFRLVLKTTNGVEVAKADAVKKWLEARGQFPPDGRMKISKKQAIEVIFKNGATKEKNFRVLSWVTFDKDGKVKKIQFNESGLDRFFNAKDMSGEDFANALVENYSEIPSLRPDVNRMEFSDSGLVLIQQETTWTHKSPKGYRLDLFERAYHSNTGLTQKQLLSDPQVSIALSLAGKLPTKRLTVVATQP